MYENFKIIKESAILRREHWITHIKDLALGEREFDIFSTAIEEKIREDITHDNKSIVDHLRLCGDIPEVYKHDSSQEKMYSKYTDALLSLSFESIGLTSSILKARGDAADVEACTEVYSLVADAKSFRLSRTAKNQKDFKIQALDTWRLKSNYAMVVCPIYQLPCNSSQIYLQAIVRNVCIFTYSHLVLLIRLAESEGQDSSKELLRLIFESVHGLNPTKNAPDYWARINKTILDYSPKTLKDFWAEEKLASTEALVVAKKNALSFLSEQRLAVMRMSKDAAIKELMNMHRFDNRLSTISKISTNNIFEFN